MNHDQEVEQSRRASIDYDQRPNTVVNGGYHIEQNGRIEEYPSQPLDPGHVERYPPSPNQTVIKQERRENADVQTAEIRTLNGVVAKHFNGTQYQEYNRQKVTLISTELFSPKIQEGSSRIDQVLLLHLCAHGRV